MRKEAVLSPQFKDRAAEGSSSRTKGRAAVLHLGVRRVMASRGLLYTQAHEQPTPYL